MAEPTTAAAAVASWVWQLLAGVLTVVATGAIGFLGWIVTRLVKHRDDEVSSNRDTLVDHDERIRALERDSIPRGEFAAAMNEIRTSIGAMRTELSGDIKGVHTRLDKLAAGGK